MSPTTCIVGLIFPQTALDGRTRRVTERLRPLSGIDDLQPPRRGVLRHQLSELLEAESRT